MKYVTKDIIYYQGSSLLADSGELYDITHRGGRLGTIVFSQALVLLYQSECESERVNMCMCFMYITHHR